MGFYIRKSISAGPFRFNLSGTGLGMSVGVKGLRIGTGPRGNYVHMGRGGLYYRASLGGGKGHAYSSRPPATPTYPRHQQSSVENLTPIETGNVLEMVPSNGSDLLQQINEKMSLWRLWPWSLGLGIVFSLFLSGQPGGQPFASVVLIATLIATALFARWDQSRKAVIIMYDLADDVAASFKAFSEEFDKVATSSRIWNIDTAGRTYDWKRNAGASHLISRKLANFKYGAPSVVKTNVNMPCIVGGRQNVYFLPDVVLITEGNKAGALAYEQLQIVWGTTVFIEGDGVPSDSQVVGQTWRFVNKNGGPDRRFNNNRQIPKVLYQQMGLQGSGGLQKILHLSRVSDRAGFDLSVNGLRHVVKTLQHLALAAPTTPGH